MVRTLCFSIFAIFVSEGALRTNETIVKTNTKQHIQRVCVTYFFFYFFFVVAIQLTRLLWKYNALTGLNAITSYHEVELALNWIKIYKVEKKVSTVFLLLFSLFVLLYWQRKNILVSKLYSNEMICALLGKQFWN